MEVRNYLELVDCTGDIADCEVYRGSVPIAMGNLSDPEYLSSQERSFELMREKLCGECTGLVARFVEIEHRAEFIRIIKERS